jgi:hypothetical protein
MTTQESFSTSDDELFVGRQGDVFIGTAANLLFTELDVLEKKTGQACTLDRFTKVGYEPNGFETAYTFSTYHIENSLIPRLSDLMDDARRRIENGDTEAEDRLRQLRRDSIEWRNHLEYNDELKSQAETKVNRSFDAGSEYTFSQTTEESSSWAWETSTEAEIGVFRDVEATAAGIGFGLSLSSSTTTASTVRQEGTQTDTRTVGYTLSDDDIGDYFTVDVKTDPVYSTPVFELRGGQSSCPWEGPTQRLDGSEVDGTVPRYKSVIQSNGSPEKTGVPPDEQATFNVTLTNDSQSGDAWRYAIRPIQSSNPNGAKLRINGGAFNGPQAYFLQPGEDGSTKITLGVERGPYAYRYEDLQVKMAPPCEQAIFEDGGGIRQADTLSLSVQFDAPCTDVNLFRPQDNWTISGTDASLETIFRNFSLTRPEQLGEVGLQYRRSDQEGWTDAFRVPADTVEQTGTELAQSEGRYEYVSDWAAVTNLPDGEYQLRAYSQCPTAEKRVYSAPAKGVKDTERPQVLDTPEPSDGVFAFGDDISVTFTEPIDCESVVTQGTNPTALLYTAGGDTLSTEIRCTGERLVFQPASTVSLAAYEDSTLTAEVKGTYTTAGGTVRDGIVDRVGNRLATADPLSNNKSWTFQVRRRAFAWNDASTKATVDFEEGGAFEETLSNGSPQDVVFDLESQRYGETWGDHPWLTPETTQGTVPGGETQAIPFRVSDTLSRGTYRDTVFANSAVGARDLDVTAKVTCRAPFGAPPEGAAYTMSLTARLDIPSALGGSGVSTDSLDQVAAFVGSELRGVASLEEVDIGGQTVSRAFLTIRSDRKLGETVTFRLWDSSECRSFFAEETVPFRANDAVGSPGAPTTLTATQAAAQSVPLVEGWSWISVNTMTEDSNAVNTALSTVVPADGDVVKGQSDFSQYSADQGAWVGSLESLRPGRGYLVHLDERGSLVLLGDSVAVDRPIDLMKGWNWLGYLPQRPYPVDHALQNLEPAPSEGDIIKSQTAFAQYVNEKVGWLGSLETLRPGRGYFLNLSEAATMAYPTGPPTQTQVTVQSVARAGASGSDEDASTRPARSVSAGRSGSTRLGPPTGASPAPSAGRSTPEPPTKTDQAMPEWNVHAQAHGQSMTIIADVQVDGTSITDPQARLGAFIGGELRGVARPVALPEQDGSRVFLVVHGAAQEEGDVSFRIFDPTTGRVHREVRLLSGLPGVNRTTARGQLPTHIDFIPGRPRGTVGDPVWINAGTLPDDFTPTQVQLKGNYPNPAARQTTVRFALPEHERVTIEMYDVLGRRIRRVVNAQKKAGWHEVTLDTQRLASGVYFYRMEAGDFQESRKMVVVK